MKYYNFGCKVLKDSIWAFREQGEDYLGNEHISDIVLNNRLGFPLYLKIYTRKREEILITQNNTLEIKHLWVDRLPNEFAYPLMSCRLRNIIEDHLTYQEGLTWVPVEVIGPDEKRTYYIPKFTKELDVLNEKKTVYGNDYGPDIISVMIPWFAKEKISRYAIFFCPQYMWQIPVGLYVNENIKKAIQKAKLTGVEFEEARVD